MWLEMPATVGMQALREASVLPDDVGLNEGAVDSPELGERLSFLFTNTDNYTMRNYVSSPNRASTNLIRAPQPRRGNSQWHRESTIPYGVTLIAAGGAGL